MSREYKVTVKEYDINCHGLSFLCVLGRHINGGFTKIALFEKAIAIQNDDGLWQVDLVCTPSAMKYIFNIEVMGYLPYMLKNIIELTSRYSYVLYIYLESRRKSPMSNSWKIGIEELKQMLRCTSETYNSYYRFNDLILKKCHKEIMEKTDLQFSYQPTDKRGRKYTNLQFTIEIQDHIDGQLSFDELSTVPQFSDQNDDNIEKWVQIYGSERLATLADGCRYEFNKPQMEQISSVLNRINIPADSLTNDITWGKRAYLREKYYALNAETAKKRNKRRRSNKKTLQVFFENA